MGQRRIQIPPSSSNLGWRKSVAIILLIGIKSNRLVVRGVFRVCARVLNAFHVPAEVDYAPPTSFLLLPLLSPRERSKNDLCTARCVVSDRMRWDRTIEFRRESHALSHDHVSRTRGWTIDLDGYRDRRRNGGWEWRVERDRTNLFKILLSFHSSIRLRFRKNFNNREEGWILDALEFSRNGKAKLEADGASTSASTPLLESEQFSKSRFTFFSSFFLSSSIAAGEYSSNASKGISFSNQRFPSPKPFQFARGCKGNTAIDYSRLFPREQVWIESLDDGSDERMLPFFRVSILAFRSRTVMQEDGYFRPVPEERSVLARPLRRIPVALRENEDFCESGMKARTRLLSSREAWFLLPIFSEDSKGFRLPFACTLPADKKEGGFAREFYSSMTTRDTWIGVKLARRFWKKERG